MGQAMHVEHIHPDGPDTLENLCLSCPSCNLSKAQAIAAPDPDTDETVPLFNPRIQRWSEHFEWRQNGQALRGLTPGQPHEILIMRLRISSSPPVFF
jgi:hypothetical protein